MYVGIRIDVNKYELANISKGLNEFKPIQSTSLTNEQTANGSCDF